MKKIRILSLLIVLSMLFLTGCNIKNAVTAKTPHVNIPFSCDFTIAAYDDMKLEGTMTRLGTGMWEMDITAPETMAGLHIRRDDLGFDLSLGELEICIEQEKINKGAFAELIFAAVDSCAAMTDIPLEQTDEGLQYTGKVSECPFIMTFEPETLLLSEISFPSIDLTASITNFCPLADTTETTVPETTTAA